MIWRPYRIMPLLIYYEVIVCGRRSPRVSN